MLNEEHSDKVIKIRQTILDATGKETATVGCILFIRKMEQKEMSCMLTVQNPNLWSIDTPYLYTIVTEVICENSVSDVYQTTFGIRTIRFDAQKGFYLNGSAVKIKGANNHQDHAGVGAAIPDGLYEFRIKKLKDLVFNAYRCSHNPHS